MKCPACDSTQIKRSQRKGTLERSVLAAVWIFPFRCQMCNERFLRMRPRGHHLGQQDTPFAQFSNNFIWIVAILAIAAFVIIVIIYLDNVPKPGQRYGHASPASDRGVRASLRPPTVAPSPHLARGRRAVEL